MKKKSILSVVKPLIDQQVQELVYGKQKPVKATAAGRIKTIIATVNKGE